VLLKLSFRLSGEVRLYVYLYLYSCSHGKGQRGVWGVVFTRPVTLCSPSIANHLSLSYCGHHFPSWV
jgi:hypothetical protein